MLCVSISWSTRSREFPLSRTTARSSPAVCTGVVSYYCSKVLVTPLGFTGTSGTFFTAFSSFGLRVDAGSKSGAGRCLTSVNNGYSRSLSTMVGSSTLCLPVVVAPRLIVPKLDTFRKVRGLIVFSPSFSKVKLQWLTRSLG